MPRDRMAVVPNLKLFDACVKPIILYCAEIWSPYTLIRDEKAIETSFNSFIPEKIQNQFLKMVLGVHRSSTNSAVLAELGRYPLYISALKLSVWYWHHIITANDYRLIKRAYNASQHDGFHKQMQSLFWKTGFSHVWANQGTFSKSGLLNSIQNKLNEQYIRAWKNSLN